MTDLDSKLVAKTSKDYYFDSYAHFGIHEEMLKDKVRTLSYMRAIYQNSHMFKDRVVLDVGCGTGILCMFAAKAGAKQVIGVDCSDIIDQARKIVDLNGFSNVITLVKGKIEEVELPVAEHGVDIIISEWMGYFLLYESMLDTVVVARDKYLAPGGVIFPDKAYIFMTAIEDADYKEEKIIFWKNVYGFDMSPLMDAAYLEPLVDVVPHESVNATAHCVKEIDVQSIKKEDIPFSANFEIEATKQDFIHAFVGYFDIAFSRCHKPLHFSTGPFSDYTHWKQTVFYLHETLAVKKGDIIKGSIKVNPNEKNDRDLDICLNYTWNGEEREEMYRLR